MLVQSNLFISQLFPPMLRALFIQQPLDGSFAHLQTLNLSLRFSRDASPLRFLLLQLGKTVQVMLQLGHTALDSRGPEASTSQRLRNRSTILGEPPLCPGQLLPNLTQRSQVPGKRELADVPLLLPQTEDARQ